MPNETEKPEATWTNAGAARCTCGANERLAYSLADIQRVFGIPRNTIRRAIAEGEITAITLNDRVVVILAEEMRRYLLAHITKP